MRVQGVCTVGTKMPLEVAGERMQCAGRGRGRGGEGGGTIPGRQSLPSVGPGEIQKHEIKGMISVGGVVWLRPGVGGASCIPRCRQQTLVGHTAHHGHTHSGHIMG